MDVLEDGQIITRTRFLRVIKFTSKTTPNAGTRTPPVLCLHGAPESHEIWYPYVEELRQTRDVLLLAFPSEYSDAPTPSPLECALGRVWKDFETLMDSLTREYPKLNVIAHDFGATWFWEWLERNKAYQNMQSIVALSVGPTMRFDFMEHGVLRPFMWCYSSFFCLSYYVKKNPIVDWAMRLMACYNAQKPVTYKSLFWCESKCADRKYRRNDRKLTHSQDWYGPLWPLRLPFDYLGVTYILAKLGLTNWGCSKVSRDMEEVPILFLTNPEIDRIAFTQDFVDFMKDDSNQGHHQVIFTTREAGHFIISNQCPRARTAMMSFLSKHGGP